MRTTIEIDDDLMKEALRLSGLKKKSDVVNLALRTFVRLKRQEGIRDLHGKVEWDDDLDEMRSTE